jgi:hypothetical protein
LCASVIGGVVIILQLVALLKASTTNMFQMCFLQIIPYPFVYVGFPYCGCFGTFFILVLQKKF